MTTNLSAAARDLLGRLCDKGMQALRDAEVAPAAELADALLAKVLGSRAVATYAGRVRWEHIQKEGAARR